MAATLIDASSIGYAIIIILMEAEFIIKFVDHKIDGKTVFYTVQVILTFYVGLREEDGTELELPGQVQPAAGDTPSLRDSPAQRRTSRLPSQEDVRKHQS